METRGQIEDRLRLENDLAYPSDEPNLGQERVELRIAPQAREELRNLLHRREMRGVGYSEFILRAVELAKAEIR